MCRGNNKQIVFRSSEDKLKYYSLLFDLKAENCVGILHYCLMDNHLHLIVWVHEGSRLARFMLQVNLGYFFYFKRKYCYDGHFWQNRYRSNLIEEDSYLIQCGKYIELNPVRAHMVTMPEEYKFSSYSHYAFGKEDKIIMDSFAYVALSQNIESRKQLYRSFVIDELLINGLWIERMRYIGSEAFVVKMQEYFQMKNTNLKRGRPRKTEK